MTRDQLTAAAERRKRQSARGLAHCLPALRYARDLVPLEARLDLHDLIREQLAEWEIADEEEASTHQQLSLQYGRTAGVVLG